MSFNHQPALTYPRFRSSIAPSTAHSSGASSYRVDFGGALQRSTHVQISTRASSVEITVPSSTAAGISSVSLLSELDVGDGFSQQEGAFWTPAAAAADRPLLTIDASVEVGQLKLRLREEERSDPRPP